MNSGRCSQITPSWNLPITCTSNFHMSSCRRNGPFQSCLKPLFQSKVKCKPIDMKTICILMQENLIFTTKILHLASFWKWEFLELGKWSIDHSRKYHNTPQCSLFVTPKFCISIVFSFSWELKWPQEKLKTTLTQNFGVTNKGHYGMLWYFLEWSIACV